MIDKRILNAMPDKYKEAYIKCELRRDMKKEYDKNGSFKEYVDKIVKQNGTTPRIELENYIVQEYFISIAEGVNEG